MTFRTDVENIPNRNWQKTLEYQWIYRDKDLRIFSVEPQAHLIATTQCVGDFDGFSPDAVFVKAFQKNYHTEAAKPGVVSNYGFEQKHGEPIEFLDYVFEIIYDRACEGQMNRYRHNSKNMESGRYTDYVKHGLTVIIPDDLAGLAHDHRRYMQFISKVAVDLEAYVDVLLDSDLPPNRRKQAARRRLGEYRASEGVYKMNLRSLVHMGAQRSDEFSPNGREAEPEISAVVTAMVKAIEPYLPVFYVDVLKQLAKGYR